MRKEYDLDNLTDNPASSAEPIAYPRYVEVARLAEPQQARAIDLSRVPTLLIEPNTLLREGLKRILSETPYNLTASAANLDEARRLCGDDGRAFLLIIGATCHHDETCRQIKAFKAEQPSARVAMLVDSYNLQQVFAAFEAGADAYLMKTVSCEVLVKSLDLAMLGETVFPSAILDLVLSQPQEPEKAADHSGFDEVGDADDGLSPKGLSVRETVILRCLMEGDSNKLIARKFDITEATVKVHVKAILRKIRAKNRTQAAIWAASHLPGASRAPAN